MAKVFRRAGCATYCIRVHIPRDRHADVGRAMGARGGLRREIVRALETEDRAEALARRAAAEAAIWRDVNAALRAAGLPPIGRAAPFSWEARAAQHRERLRAASPDRVIWRARDDDGREEEETERDHLLHAEGLADDIREEVAMLRASRGPEVAERFERAATETRPTFDEAAAAWVAQLREARAAKAQTIAGHEAVFRLFRQFLATKGEAPALLALGDVSRPLAREFVRWRGAMPSPKGKDQGRRIGDATLAREVSSLSGLWRWAMDEGLEGVDANPFANLGRALSRSRAPEDAEPSKRPFTPAELVALLRATGDDWAPNRGGYGPALWDATRLALLTGLRANELASLRCGDVARGAVAVAGGKTKSARREVPLCEPAQAVVAARVAALPSAAPSDPLFPEVPRTGPDGRRGKTLAQRWNTAMRRILNRPASGLSDADMHSLRRSFAQALRDAMERGEEGSITTTMIAALMGHAGGTLALDTYTSGAQLRAKQRAIKEMWAHGLDPQVREAIAATAGARPAQIRTAPATRPQRRAEAPPAAPKRRGRPPNSVRAKRASAAS